MPENHEMSPSPHLVLSHPTSVSIETRVEMGAAAMSQSVGWFIEAKVRLHRSSVVEINEFRKKAKALIGNSRFFYELG